ncbi:hypothetical protein AVEN_55300-1 [Araneus ventricosus]|uniref:Uncharacterized protein n=1 Tax=Araneus ventricosus TaxID=182803 RepID=A0A4Y2DA87_ARAVE|nr:hypothetical protein AVEN_55300-1 [Araneus ventricosus]
MNFPLPDFVQNLMQIDNFDGKTVMQNLFLCLVPFSSHRALRRIALHFKSYVLSETSSCWCGEEVWRGVPAHVSSSSSGHCSKGRGPSQNNPLVASKRDVNISKLNETKSTNQPRETDIIPKMVLRTRGGLKCGDPLKFRDWIFRR